MKEKNSWRIIVGILSVIYLIFLWVKKDIASAYTALSPEQLFPVILMSVAITSIKLIGIAGGTLLIKWLIRKIKTGL